MPSSRSGRSVTGRELIEGDDGSSRRRDLCLDGETGHPIFNRLLFRRAQPFFYAFDVLWLDGEDLRHLPLIERKRRLRQIIRADPAGYGT